MFYWKFANLIGSLMVGLLSDRCPVREIIFDLTVVLTVTI